MDAYGTYELTFPDSVLLSSL